MTTVRTVEPGSEPVTLAEAKAHCRVDASDDDSYITSLIVAARQACEQKLNRPLIQSTFRLTLDEFPDGIIELSAGLTSVTSVKYYDTTNAQVTTTDYYADIADFVGRVWPYAQWPETYDRPSSVEVIYVAGWANAAAVPQAIKHWILMRIGTMYDSRTEYAAAGRDVKVASLPFVDSLLDPWKVPLL